MNLYSVIIPGVFHFFVIRLEYTNNEQHSHITQSQNWFKCFCVAENSYRASFGYWRNCWFSSLTIISGNVVVGRNCFVSANSTVGHNISVGNYCFFGSNSLHIKDLPDKKVVIIEPSSVVEISSRDFSKIFR